MLKVDNVKVTYKNSLFKKGVQALRGISLEVHPGDVYGLLGPNGAGKSTAMYTFLGLIKPDSGRVMLNGKVPQPGSEDFDRIAYLPEEAHYHLYLTVEEALRFYVSLYRDRSSIKPIESLLEMVELEKFRKLPLKRCSKGMKQKLGLAACLAKEDVDIVFFDEPTRGLDPIMVHRFREIVMERNARGTTVILNSHVLGEIEAMCNRVSILSKGQVVKESSVQELRTTNRENYSVEFELPKDELPDYVAVTRRINERVQAEIAVSDVGRFFEFCSQNNILVYACALQQSTLEDVFINIVQGKN